MPQALRRSPLARRPSGVARLCAVICGAVFLCSCSDGAGQGDSAQRTSSSVDLSGLSIEESRKLRGAAAREAQLQKQACLEEQGFPSQMTDDGMLQVDVGGQHEAFERASAECDEVVDYGAAAAPLSEAEIRWLYDENVKAFDCLVAEGFTPEEPVSFEVFLAEYQEGRPPWTPFLTAESNAPIMTQKCQEPSINLEE